MTAVHRRFPWIGVGVLILCCVYCTIVLSNHDWDVLTFVDIGSRFAEGDPAGTIGYDGQFTYYIATDPLGAPARVDDPPYRYQRILYPLVVYVLSLGRAFLVPWVMVGVNVVALSVSAELLGRLLRQYVMSPIFGTTFVLWIGQVSSLRLSLNEPLCFMLVLWAIWWHRRGRYGLSTLAFSLGILAKEQALLFLIGAMLHHWLQGRRRQAVVQVLLSVMPYLLWQVVLCRWLGKPGVIGKGVMWEVVPFYGMRFIEPLEARVFTIFVLAVPMGVLTVAAVIRLLRGLRGDFTVWALLANVMFLVFMTRRSYIDVIARFRLSTGLVLAAQLFCARHGLRKLNAALAGLWTTPVILASLQSEVLW
jgi:hypothetical protein